jgi:hypothetical protein
VGAAPDLNLDLLAASLRADASDVGAFVEGLAAKLEDALPGRVSVERRRTGLLGGKKVRAIAVNTGDRRLELRVDDGPLETTASRLSGGIVLKRETLDTDTWLAALGQALAEEAKRSDATRQALERLLIR